MISPIQPGSIISTYTQEPEQQLQPPPAVADPQEQVPAQPVVALPSPMMLGFVLQPDGRLVCQAIDPEQ